MSELLDEAASALRDEPVLGRDAEATLARIQRTLAASADTSRLALEAADAEADGGDALLDRAATALRDEPEPAHEHAMLARILGTLAAPDASRLALEAADAEAEGDPRLAPSLDPLLDPLLDEAALALRDATADPWADDATLARIHDSLASAHDAVDRAAAELRAQTDATASGEPTLARILESIAAHELDHTAEVVAHQTSSRVDGAPTEQRVLRTLAKRRSRSGWLAVAAAVLLAVVVTPTAWAWSTGRLQRWLGIEPEPRTAATTAEPIAPAPPRETVTRPTRARSETPVAEVAPEIALPIEPPVVPEPIAPEAPPIARVAPPRPRPVARVAPAPVEPAPVEEAPAPVEPSADARERALFQAAHRLHFGGPADEATLRAWDAYLAAHPHGRYAPEARYNRALTLIRLGRRDEARRALQPFADAPEGAYRSEEARALVDALGAP